MKIQFDGRDYGLLVWTAEYGSVGGTIAYDTETTAHGRPGGIEDYVVGTVCNGQTVYVVCKQDLTAFWDGHRNGNVYLHTAAFDLAVTSKCCGFDFDPMIQRGGIIDIAILWRLCRLAITGNVPERWSLDRLAADLLDARLSKDEAVRTGFGEYLRDGAVDYAAIPMPMYEYAARDAIATFLLGQRIEAEAARLHGRHTDAVPHGLLSHDIQLKGEIALRHIERFGLHVDGAAVTHLEQELDADIQVQGATLARYGYVPGAKGNRKRFNEIILDLERRRGASIKVTQKSGDKSQCEDDLLVLADEEFVQAYLAHKKAEKIRRTYVAHLHTSRGKIYPRYNALLKTGRTSCRGPNIQNLPRKGHVRECLVPTPGHVFLAADYGTLELCTLAQITHQRYGESKMRELINAGVDLHRYVASKMLRKPEDEITGEERRRAKAANFGLPGGLGTRGLMQYADAVFGVHLTVDEAEKWRGMWLDVFPEARKYLTEEGNAARLARVLRVDELPDDRAYVNTEIGAFVLIRIAGGAKCTTSGRLFSRGELDWAWEQIAQTRAAKIKRLQDDIRNRRGSLELQRAIIPGLTVVTPTGRVRADCTFCQSRNLPFQALAADGAKLALYDLVRAGYRVVAFIHDEVLIEIPEGLDYLPVATAVEQIMVGAMRRVCPDVKITVELAVMRRWRKDAEAAYDGSGRLIAFEDVRGTETRMERIRA
ncbi:MAG: hypothetical protein JXR37_17965 [Kiritimatiellae bacterium]|nr:hypothetical protein [Kiritimatiellia bacterium]